ncbi:MAG: elongator complex protein 3 [Eubacteriales bacterium]
MKTSHVNIPVFIPHLGCPNMCVFCNQRAISGVSSFVPDMIQKNIDTVLSTVKEETVCEIAFFGGSFTGIDRGEMVALLDFAQSYVRSGRVSGIRMSTRPDYIDGEILGILKNYTISAVELGIQSFSESVLTACRRGHSAEQSRKAMTLLRDAGFAVVGQMMLGLPGAALSDELACAEEICRLGAAGTRIYPTIVFCDTELYRMTLSGDYRPLTVEEAVERGAAVLDVFVRHDVPCLRIGLCESENLHSASAYFAGPNHPALGELISGELYYRRICEALDRHPPEKGSCVTVAVPRGDLSMAVGQKRRNKIRIEIKYSVKSVKFIEKDNVTRYNIQINPNKEGTPCI